MSVTWETFERYRQKGLDARRAGQWDSARVYLLEAARAMVSLGKGAMGEELREGRKQMAQRLLELARDCDAAAKEDRRAGNLRRTGQSAGASAAQASESEGETSGQQWVIRERSSLRFADVAGLEDVKQDIRLKMIYPFEHPELAEKFGIRPGGGVLMYGPPGTGKTMLAKATAGEIDATFFRISPADVLSKWVGEAEQNIKKLFDAAAGEKRSIIFIDEIEALVPARRDDGSSVMQRVVPQILQEVEGFDKKAGRPILLMGATNVPWQLDPAMLRPGRFDEKVYIPLPDLPARRKMLDLYLAHRPVAVNVDLDAIALQMNGYSGADIRYLCDRAATIPFLRSVASGGEEEITPDVLGEAFAEVQPSVTAPMLRRFEDWTRSSEVNGAV
ncbi:MAG TPA: ATP-binding protein [Tepidisphaeraceae bacterium]|jgi:transitional endoplasmic reticulum ATPase|nr:ATP-binding protein [Tepidisphaeraceae bacterium]